MAVFSNGAGSVVKPLEPDLGKLESGRAASQVGSRHVSLVQRQTAEYVETIGLSRKHSGTANGDLRSHIRLALAFLVTGRTVCYC